MYKSITLLSSEQESELKSDFRKNLGERLKRKREKAGLTQKELGYCISEMEVQKRKADKQQLLIQKGENKILKAQSLCLLSSVN